MTRANTYDLLVQKLKQHGHRITGPRRALLRLLTDTREPLSVQEMYFAMNKDGETETEGNSHHDANVVTVYRFVNLLVDLGLARRIEFGEGFYRYECEEPQNGPHHHHLVCRRCGKIEDFLGCDLLGLITRLETETGFSVEHHMLELFGSCPACRK